MSSVKNSEDGTVFIIDDEYSIRDSLFFLIRSRHLLCAAFDSAESFLDQLSSYDSLMTATVLLDVRMEGLSGVKLFQRLRDLEVIWPVIFLTGHAHIEMAVDVMKAGAFDFVEKPFNNNKLVDVILEALNECRHRVYRFRNREKMISSFEAMNCSDRETFRHFIERISAYGTLSDSEEKILSQFGVDSLSDFYALIDDSGLAREALGSFFFH